VAEHDVLGAFNDDVSMRLDHAEMQYTCAYYESPDLSLEQAQLAKLEHVCRKLRLQPGQTVVEAGFRAGSLQLFQVVFTHGDNNNLLPTRKHLYSTSAAPES
jgi:hypothetical protein